MKRLPLLALAMACLVSGRAWGAIAINGTPVTTYTTAAGGTTLTLGYTSPATTSNDVLVFMAYYSALISSGTSGGISTPQWGSTNFTFEQQAVQAGASNNITAEIFYLVNPTANTTQNVTFKPTGTFTTGNAIWGLEEYSGVNQSTPFGAFSVSTFTSTGTKTSNFNSTVIGSWMLMNSGAFAASGLSDSIDASFTQRWNILNSLNTDVQAVGDKALPSLANYSISNVYAATGFQAGAQIIAELLPVGVGTSTPTPTPTFSASPTVTPTPAATATPGSGKSIPLIYLSLPWTGRNFHNLTIPFR